MVNLLLHLGGNINKALMHSGKTPLLVAISYGFLELTKFLISKGASVRAVDINGLGAMHYAVSSENFEMIGYFVDMGLEVNPRDKNGLTPLLRAGLFAGTR
ncbi:ankyrin repeat-containing protein DDB_G0279043-like isoform X2 [Harmonia axyridis]|uniref:ankyrin repeat-containing protein DDB_G0279043-like isoform X2 n=1 Tax=Harmonia axyridis TaxID=115357 RepID=UPI001E279CA3|nr:ankyrin repeat-containing protein DDB_G0279043-like isoform X2 [Harmonia axyridis]